MKWQTMHSFTSPGGTFQALVDAQGRQVISLERTSIACRDRGEYIAKVHPAASVRLALDNGGGWPRYYSSRQSAKQEIRAWAAGRGVH